jgi:hypothetical protein
MVCCECDDYNSPPHIFIFRNIISAFVKIQKNTDDEIPINIMSDRN